MNSIPFPLSLSVLVAFGLTFPVSPPSPPKQIKERQGLFIDAKQFEVNPHKLAPARLTLVRKRA